jgi:hypothetical protein
MTCKDYRYKSNETSTNLAQSNSLLFLVSSMKRNKAQSDAFGDELVQLMLQPLCSFGFIAPRVGVNEQVLRTSTV